MNNKAKRFEPCLGGILTSAIEEFFDRLQLRSWAPGQLWKLNGLSLAALNSPYTSAKIKYLKYETASFCDHVSANNVPHDLVGAFQNFMNTQVAEESLYWEVAQKAVAAV